MARLLALKEFSDMFEKNHINSLKMSEQNPMHGWGWRDHDPLLSSDGVMQLGSCSTRAFNEV